MVGINKTIILLLVANLVAFFASGFIGFSGDVSAAEQEITKLENSLPKLQEQKEWETLADKCLLNPPEADSGQLLGKWSQMATRLGLEMAEAAQTSGKTSEIKLSGSGQFNNISMILNNIGTERAALLKRISLELGSDEKWLFDLNVMVRTGEWEYIPTQQKSPVPEDQSSSFATISPGKPFAESLAKAQPIRHTQENIRYIGYFADQATPAIILESSGKFAVLKCGETTPGGSIIMHANAEELKLGKKDESGKENVWTVKMEKK